MRKQYQNEYLGQSKPDLKKEWDSLWDRTMALNPQKDYKELDDLNKRFDKCVEAYYAVDCGDHWVVSKGTDVKRKCGTFKVQKGTYLIIR